MTTYLKFDTEEQFNAAFEQYATDGVVPSYIGTTAVDVVGVIHRPTGKTVATDEGPMPEYAPIPGWHVNLSGECPEDLAEFLIDAPNTPSRVFAGD